MKQTQKKCNQPRPLKLANCIILSVKFYKNGNIHLVVKPYHKDYIK